MPAKEKYDYCNKCNTENSLVYEYNGRWLCKANMCYQEEVEKDSGVHEEREERLQQYKRMCQGTNTGG